MTKVQSSKGLWTGVLYIAFGAAAMWIGKDYPFGTAGRMGAGYFPVVLAGALVLIGAVIAVRSFLVPGEPVGSLAWKPMGLVLGATALFGLLIQPAGLIVALPVLVLMSAAASGKFRFDWKAAVGLVVLVAFCSLVFVRGLGVPMPLIGPWFERSSNPTDTGQGAT